MYSKVLYRLKIKVSENFTVHLENFSISLFIYSIISSSSSSSYSRGTEVEKMLQRSIETKTRYASSDE